MGEEDGILCKETLRVVTTDKYETLSGPNLS